MATRATAVLPASDAKMQFQTPFVTTELNRKSVGIVPAGIYRGFNVTALGFIVTVNTDVGTNDSVAVCRTINASLVENQYNVTVRHEGNIDIDFSGVTVSPTMLVLEARYDLTSPTPVEGLTEVRIKAVDPGDVMPYHVVLAEITNSPGPPIVDTSTANTTGGTLVTQNQLISATSPFVKMATAVRTAGDFGVNTGGAFVDCPGPIEVSVTVVSSSVLVEVQATGTTVVSNPAIVGLGLKVDGIEQGTGGSGLVFGGAQGCGINQWWGDLAYKFLVTGLAPGLHTFRLTGVSSGFLGGLGSVYANPVTPLRMFVWYN